MKVNLIYWWSCREDSIYCLIIGGLAVHIAIVTWRVVPGGMLENTSICYECLDPVCSECYLFGNGMGHCTICEKKYCTGCVTVKRCTYCTEKYCEGCGEMEDCDECEKATCDDCLYNCDVCNMNKCTNCSEYHDCDWCRKSHCADCYDGKEFSVKYCEVCTSTFCSGCRLDQIKNYGFICNTCAPEENTK